MALYFHIISILPAAEKVPPGITQPEIAEAAITLERHRRVPYVDLQDFNYLLESRFV
jgi:hypothetical protein